MSLYSVAESWNRVFPGAHAGLLVLRGASNPPFHAGLEQSKLALQAELRQRFAGQDRQAIAALAVIQTYTAHYKQFKKTYHVQSQFESIVFKDRDIPSVAALVEAMFMAEMKNLLLTAGHDLDLVKLPVRLGVSDGSEVYTTLRGQEQALKAEDMMMTDQLGVISDVIYGPDQRTQIQAGTQNALFCTYAPAGIPPGDVQAHLQDIIATVLQFAPQTQVELMEVVP